MSNSAEDRYAKAVVSSHLNPSALSIVDVDVLTAAGWAGAHSGNGETLASLVYRAAVNPNTPQIVHTAHTAVLSYATLLSKRLAPPTDPDRAASIEMLQRIRPQCPACKGVRFERIAHTARLGSIACPECKGTGDRRIPKVEGKLFDLLHYELNRKMEAFMRQISRTLH